MDFYDLLKEAAKNKQKSQKELQENKRYNLNFKPMKKISRPKVNKAAIEAQLKKKEEEQRKKAEQEEKDRQRVLALRAEQESAKTSKRQGNPSSNLPSSTKSEKSTGKRKTAKQDGRSENLPEKKKTNHSFPTEEKYKDFRLNNKQEEEPKYKSKPGASKSLPEPKPKVGAPSFKELMNIAASNTRTSNPISNGLDNHSTQCQPNVKLKGKAESQGEKTKSDSKKISRQGQSSTKNEKSALRQQISHRESGQSSKTHTTSKSKMPAPFPSKKTTHKPENNVKHRSLESSHKTLPGKASKPSVHRHDAKGAPEVADSKVREKVKGNDIRREAGQQPVKRKGGWLDPIIEPKRKLEDLNNKKNSNLKQGSRPGEKKNATVQGAERPREKKGGWLDPIPKTPAMDVVRQADTRGKAPSKDRGSPSEIKGKNDRRKEVDQHPVKRKGGWLDPITEPKRKAEDVNNKKKIAAAASPAVSKVKKNPVPPVKEKKRGWLDEEVVPKPSGPVKGKKSGWLDPPREQSGGWLGPMRDPSERRPGGWLGPVREPSMSARRGRLLSSEDEEEDSDMDDFIDDSPLEGSGGRDVSSYIKEIFGYDKSAYKYESDYALRSMEASYSQILKEEARSARIAQQEDAEEWRKEKEREKKKLAAKAKRK